ncbi:MAG: PDZ domain-containing protein [Alphaproteobacteria bacterium]|nr:PDZ domain-containing protein [Alphaproteobacteria bacterium]
MNNLIAALLQPVSFLILISVVITVHELGHYLVGRFFGAAVESFSVGFGKPLLTVKDRRGTHWRINWLPLGGFVKFVGEMQSPKDSRETVDGPVGKAFTQIAALPRLAISLGGPAANFIFAILVYTIWALSFGLPVADQVRVSEVIAGGPAQAAGFKVGDVLVEAGGRKVETSNDVSQATILRAGEPVEYRILRDGQPMVLKATPVSQAYTDPVYKVTEKTGHIGLGMAQGNLHFKRLGPIAALGYGVSHTADTIGTTVTVLRRLVTGRDGLDKLNGPVGMLNFTGNVTDAHIKDTDVGMGTRLAGLALDIVQMAALFSIGVGFFNLLPIPVLDGGAAVMCIAESITGREIPERVQRVGLTIGLACLISFAVVITWNDITRWLTA